MRAVAAIVLASAIAIAPRHAAAAPPSEVPPPPAPADGRSPVGIPTDVVAPDDDVPQAEPPPPTPVEPAADEEPAGDGESNELDEYDPVLDSPEGIVATNRIRGGAFLSVFGALLGAGAAALGTSDPCSRPAGNSCGTASRNRAAIVMGSSGVALLAAGLTLLGLGIARRRELRAGVSASARGGGLVIEGRF
jgi:hypothetical protein